MCGDTPTCRVCHDGDAATRNDLVVYSLVYVLLLIKLKANSTESLC
jgi:hypothetical protein